MTTLKSALLTTVLLLVLYVNQVVVVAMKVNETYDPLVNAAIVLFAFSVLFHVVLKLLALIAGWFQRRVLEDDNFTVRNTPIIFRIIKWIYILSAPMIAAGFVHNNLMVNKVAFGPTGTAAFYLLSLFIAWGLED